MPQTCIQASVTFSSSLQTTSLYLDTIIILKLSLDYQVSQEQHSNLVFFLSVFRCSGDVWAITNLPVSIKGGYNVAGVAGVSFWNLYDEICTEKLETSPSCEDRGSTRWKQALTLNTTPSSDLFRWKNSTFVREFDSDTCNLHLQVVFISLRGWEASCDSAKIQSQQFIFMSS